MRQRHLAVRTYRYHRPSHGPWRLLIAAGVIAAVGYGAYTLLNRVGAHNAGQLGTFRIEDAYSGSTLPGARLTFVPLVCQADACQPAETTARGVVGRMFSTDAHGEVHARLDASRVALTVTEADYDSRHIELAWPPTESIRLALRPAWVAGRITALGEPLVGVGVQAIVPGTDIAVRGTTDDDGRYRLTGVPEGASLIVEAPNISRRPHPIERRATVDLALRPDILTGTVRDTNGQPARGVIVVAGDAVAQTDENGRYQLEGVDAGTPLIVKGIGYRTQTLTLGANLTQDITLQPFTAKGIYVQAPVAADPAKLDKVLNLIATRDLNTLVIDLKDNNGEVFYDSQVPLAREVGAINPILKPAQLVQMLHAKGIYAIARIVVMEDPIAAVKRPDLAIKNARTGKPWRTNGGQPWLNPTNPQVWRYISDLAVEAATFGFDEVQFDYVRFPSDGDLDASDYGPNFTGGSEQRRAAITGFLKTAHDKLLRTHALMGADIFGITAWIKNDNGIGQMFEDLVPLVDVICPMDYPSHYSRGFNGWDMPNNYAHDVIKQSLMVREARIPGVARKSRPWLQAFTYGPGVEYGTAQVYAQIQACNEMGSAGYLLWNIESAYNPDWIPPKPDQSDG